MKHPIKRSSPATPGQILFVTGTDTGVGKTVFAAALTRRLHERGVRVAALKPLCSGGREDAVALREAAGDILPLGVVNPWHFRAALSPLLAARAERKRVKLGEVVKHVRAVQKEFDVLVVEGAGGVLSPLGEDFDSRDLIAALRAEVIVVCPNRLGAVNQLRLVIEALPPLARQRIQSVLVALRLPDAASRTNRRLLEEFIKKDRLHDFPWLRRQNAREDRAATRALDRILQRIC